MDGGYYNYETTTDPSISGAVAGIMIVVWLIILAISIITLIGQWKTLKKGNKPGWAAIVPIYNRIVQCQMVGVSPWWILIMFIPMIGSIASIYFLILLGISTARAFGKSDGFGVGLILLPFVFYPMLGFGKDQFIGMNPMEDIIFKNNNQQANNPNMNMQQPTGQTINYIYCSKCGNQVPNTNKFCTRCGNPLQ